ncbi:hypothetical protein PO864_14970 [Providencia alcalifaciens]|uniref:Uncharacterized protein n=1 Tax=Providencia alcalifaciens 205/92 TaxID=1256988 RepID=A0AAV3M9G5_9GAMM|nr:hypothetical protein [Providencia alcalifaciens]EUD12232.1 hypothetical protein HMPREF1563_1550 [Providencia alcalifaciens 205/92]MTC16573.1 hypothetical protein [Providencia alcalifaciens]WGZ53537.1 hypothetical protein PO864_14970 [Providencia alcalifaciens]
MDKLADVRAVFEKLYKEQTVFIENTHGYDSQKFALWAGFQLGWQASRESLEVELPDKYTLEYMQDDLSDSECDFFKCNDIKNELLSNGVKIKNG